jgi:hypothetical protein
MSKFNSESPDQRAFSSEMKEEKELVYSLWMLNEYELFVALTRKKIVQKMRAVLYFPRYESA